MKLKWERDYGEVNGDEVTVTDVEWEKSLELFVRELKEEDFGNYICLAENEMGTAYENFIIKRKGK